MENLPLALIDIVLLLVLLVGAWRGFTKGLVLSVASLVGLVGGIWAASHFSHMVAKQLSPHVTWSVNTLHMASLALTFLLVVVAVHLLAKVLERSSNWCLGTPEQTRWCRFWAPESGAHLVVFDDAAQPNPGSPSLSAQFRDPFRSSWAAGGIGPSTGPSHH